MTELTKPIKRETPSTVFERSELRNLIVSIEPAGHNEAVIGIKVKGSRRTYRIGVNSVYNMAVRLHLDRIEKRTKQLRKEGVPARSARARATKEIDKELRS